MENNKEKPEKKEYKPGDIINHTHIPGEKNPLPPLTGDLRWRGYEKDENTGKFFSYICDDPNAPDPSIDEQPPLSDELSSDEPLFKTKEEAEEYRRNNPKEEKEEYNPTKAWRWTDYDKD